MNFLKSNLKTLLGFVLGIFVTLAAQTSTKVDDVVVGGLKNGYDQYIKEQEALSITSSTVIGE